MQPCFILFWLSALSFFRTGLSVPCMLRDLGHGNKVCVCNATYCDTVDRVTHVPKGRFIAIVSTEDGQRFAKTEAPFSSSPYNSELTGTYKFIVNNTKRFQKILGFGGAFTDSAGMNINALSEQSQTNLLRSYFSPKGIEYNIGRVPMGGSDFSTHFYSYDDGNIDPDLKNFQLSPEDFTLKIPLIKKAIKMSKRPVSLMASSWSPPNWMKTRNVTAGFCFLKKEYYDTYSRYLLRFFDEYEKQGLHFWSMTTGNEPSLGFTFSRINSLGWMPWQASEWIVDSLGPLLRNSTHNQTLLIAFDDQRLFLPWWMELMVRARKNVMQFISGISVHWYWDWLVGPGVIEDIYRKYPEQFILYGESSMGSKPWEKHVDLGSWTRGERYLHSILENMNHGVGGWLDWNIALDPQGGPTYINNNLDSPIIVEAAKDEFYKQPMFYALGHVAKFIDPGAVRVELTPAESGELLVSAVQNPGGRLVVVVLNKKSSHVDVAIYVPEKGWINILLPAKSYTTILC